jgi:signal transduction histidine kinase
VDCLEFYVKDSGIGIPQDRHNVIFERLFQADITNKMAHQGSWIGFVNHKSVRGNLAVKYG